MLKNIEAKHKYNLESELYEALFVPKLILQKCIGDIFAGNLYIVDILPMRFWNKQHPIELHRKSRFGAWHPQ